MLEDFEFRLRTRTDSQSSEAMIMSYLNSKNTLYPAKDMAMIALTSFWLPLAYQAVGSQPTNIDLEAHIRSCLYRLRLHEQYLLELLGKSINPPENVITSTPQEAVITPDCATSIDDVVNTPLRSDVHTLTQTLPEQLVISPDETTEWFNPFSNPK